MQLHHVAHGTGNAASQAVGLELQASQVDQLTKLNWQRPSELIVVELQVRQTSQITQTRWDGSCEKIRTKIDPFQLGVTTETREGPTQLVVRHEQKYQRRMILEDCFKGSSELVEAEVHVMQPTEIGKLSGKGAIQTHIGQEDVRDVAIGIAVDELHLLAGRSIVVCRQGSMVPATGHPATVRIQVMVQVLRVPPVIDVPIKTLVFWHAVSVRLACAAEECPQRVVLVLQHFLGLRVECKLPNTFVPCGVPSIKLRVDCHEQRVTISPMRVVRIIMEEIPISIRSHIHLAMKTGCSDVVLWRRFGLPTNL
mmetsp:Transcript_22768/g.53114  ORF Transcript_22768/g.53114 Transcript_22768/m.53114 type:complete len:310 (-) Transcript_22768:444-1373(-)